MKRFGLIVWMLVVLLGSASAQHDDLYFVPKKKKTVSERVEEKPVVAEGQPTAGKTLLVSSVSAKPFEMDEDTYNRRGSYLTEQGEPVSEFAMNDEGFVLITEEGDTMWMNTDTLRLARVEDDERWVNGFDGSDSDYEYAMRIVRFRNPRYAIPVSSPLYWDVVYGGALWPSWDWNIYDDGMYAYVFPTRSNWYYWDYMMSYPLGWNYHWSHHHGCHWGHHWGYPYGWQFYGHVWYDPWFNPYFHDYHPGWHHGHHHGYYPGLGVGGPGWGGVAPKSYPNHRTSADASTRRQGADSDRHASANASSSSRTGNNGATRRADNGVERSSSVRVVTNRSGVSSSSNVVRSSGSSRTGNDEMVRRSTGTGSSSVNRTSATNSSSRSTYSRSSTSSSGSASNSRISSSSSSSMSRSTSSGSSSSSSRSSYDSSSSSSHSSGSSRSSFSSGSSYSGSSRGGGYSSGSYSGGSSRSSGTRR